MLTECSIIRLWFEDYSKYYDYLMLGTMKSSGKCNRISSPVLPLQFSLEWIGLFGHLAATDRNVFVDAQVHRHSFTRLISSSAQVHQSQQHTTQQQQQKKWSSIFIAQTRSAHVRIWNCSTIHQQPTNIEHCDDIKIFNYAFVRSFVWLCISQRTVCMCAYVCERQCLFVCECVVGRC